MDRPTSSIRLRKLLLLCARLLPLRLVPEEIVLVRVLLCYAVLLRLTLVSLTLGFAILLSNTLDTMTLAPIPFSMNLASQLVPLLDASIEVCDTEALTT